MQNITKNEFTSNNNLCYSNDSVGPEPEIHKNIREKNNIRNTFDCTTYNINIDLDEFEQVLSNCRKGDTDNLTQLHIQECNKVETIIEIKREVAKNVELNNFIAHEKVIQHDNRNNEICVRNIKDDVISINSNESLIFCISDHSVDLDAISLASNNIFALEKSNATSIEIDIDLSREISSQNVLDTNDLIDLDEVNHTDNDFENECKENSTNFDTNSNCSYHSSDFELITEEEAKKDGIIINFKRNDGIVRECNDENYIEMYLPGYNEVTYRDNHRIPDGDEFYDLFRGAHAPANVPDLFLENKAVVPAQCMSVEKEASEFNFWDINKGENANRIDEEYLDEAKETAKRILEFYQTDNKRRRSRRCL
ncbi:uncharacterized protein LOC132903738 [Amyelois transitella]|uniref:uncharacterized protein LOC132903738 n=1 Tax=Amyelois transitella TaxID=680683 RepID=UPI0029904105|nr:uncharacterized protein LOC132903738 [Amyelois transitella]